MKAAEIEIGGVYMANVEKKLEAVVVLSTGKTTWHRYPRTLWNCLVARTGERVRFTDVKRFRRAGALELTRAKLAVSARIAAVKGE